MLNRMGPRRYVIPILIVILMGAMMGCMFYPMAHMQMKGLPFAVVSLDEGMATPQGEVNAGDTLVDTLTASSDDDEDATIVWTKLDSQEELDEALDNMEYYGAIVVPSDFTQGQMAAQAGQGEMPALDVVIDRAKSPMVATQMQSSIASMFSELGMSTNVEVIHNAPGSDDADGSTVTALPMSSMASIMLGIMPLFMLSFITSMFLSRIFRKKAPAKQRWKSIGQQVAYALGISLLIAIACTCLQWWVGGIEAPIVATALFLWFASFCIMLVFIGAINISMALGAVIMILCMAFGMMTGNLPYEMLPTFWQDWIYPWAPQHYISEGIRSVIYLGDGAWNRASLPLLIYGLAGIVLAVIAGLIPHKTEEEKAAARKEIRDASDKELKEAKEAADEA